MPDLTAFLAARYDEDEAAAQAASAPSPWKSAEHEDDSWIVTDATGEPLIYNEGTPDLLEAAHIARHDPARVLREVAAKRAILAEHQPSADGTCKTCIKIDADYPQIHEYWEVVKWPCATVRALIAIYQGGRSS